MIKMLIFDFDGVIDNNYDLHFSLSKKQIDGITREEHRKLFEGNIHVEREKLQARNTGFDLKKHFNAAKMSATTTLEIREALESLSKRYALGIISSGLEYGILGYLKNNHLDELFSFVYGFETGVLKSDKFNKVFETFRVTKDECLFVTDTLGDIREANAVGVGAIAIDSGYHERERLLKGQPLAIISHLSELVTMPLDH